MRRLVVSVRLGTPSSHWSIDETSSFNPSSSLHLYPFIYLKLNFNTTTLLLPFFISPPPFLKTYQASSFRSISRVSVSFYPLLIVFNLGSFLGPTDLHDVVYVAVDWSSVVKWYPREWVGPKFCDERPTDMNSFIILPKNYNFMSDKIKNCLFLVFGNHKVQKI